MKKRLSMMAAALAMSFSSAHALDCCVADWEVTAEFLYMAPSFDDNYFVIKSPVTSTNPNGQRDFNSVGFNPGFRIGGALDLDSCGRQIEIYYTRLRADHTKTVRGDFLWATQGRPDIASVFDNYSGLARSYVDALYQRIDADVIQAVCLNNGLSVSFLAGLEWAYLDVVENINYISAVNNAFIGQESKIWGIGPQVGFILGYHLWDNSCSCPGTLSFVARSTVSLLASNDQAKSHDVLNSEAQLDVRNAASWRVIPALHLRLGLNYLMQISCYDVGFEIGYAFDSYIRGYTRQTYLDDIADALTINHYGDFDLQGLYVNGTFKY